MATLIKLQANKTYATPANAVAAVEKKIGHKADGQTYIMMTDDNGRFFPVFLGERAIQAGIHFHFNVAG